MDFYSLKFYLSENESTNDFVIEMLPFLNEIELSKSITIIYLIFNCHFASFRIIPEKSEIPALKKELIFCSVDSLLISNF